MEPCSKREREGKHGYLEQANCSLFLHPSSHYSQDEDFDKYQRVKLPISFTYFKVDFFMAINVAPSHITPNLWGVLRAIQIICCSLGVSPKVSVFLSYFRTLILSNYDWVTLHPLQGGYIYPLNC